MEAASAKVMQELYDYARKLGGEVSGETRNRSR